MDSVLRTVCLLYNRMCFKKKSKVTFLWKRNTKRKHTSISNTRSMSTIEGNEWEGEGRYNYFSSFCYTSNSRNLIDI